VPKVSPAYIDGRRQEILQAALRCFARNGFHETTIQDIAREASVSHGAIYRYFATKDDIVEAASQRDRRARARRFAEAEQAGTPLDVIDRLLAGYITRYWPQQDLQPKLRTQLLGEAVRNPRIRQVVHTHRGEVIDRMSAIIRRAQQRGQIEASLDARAAARVLAAIYEGLLVQQALDSEFDMGACSRVVTTLLRGTFAARRDGQEVEDGRQPALRTAAS
jgi:AcrR family transcriptional regulator